jgi:choline dehydrogenase
MADAASSRRCDVDCAGCACTVTRLKRFSGRESNGRWRNEEGLTFDAFTASVCQLRPSSRGSVRITSSDPATASRIAPNYLSTEEDLHVAANALRLTRRIVSASALERFRPQEILPGIQFQTEEELRYAAGNVGTTIFHPVGTCRMGAADDPGAVVDSRLRVHGMSGLRVVDASIMPTITSGNTHSPTLMIAERVSEMIRADRKRSWSAAASVHDEACAP